MFDEQYFRNSRGIYECYSKSSNFSHAQWNVDSRRRDINVSLDFTLRKLFAILLLWSVKKNSFSAHKSWITILVRRIPITWTSQ